jgi:hypothetical protein
MKVVWTINALKTYFSVSDYIQSEWGNTVVKNFADKVEKITAEIKRNPFMFEESEKYKNVRKGFITEYNIMF